jgi:hypothetical protein
MLVSPTQVVLFFQVSRQFVSAQLEQWDWDLRPLAPAVWPRTLFPFPPGIVPDGFMAKGIVQIRINKSPDELIEDPSGQVVPGQDPGEKRFPMI